MPDPDPGPVSLVRAATLGQVRSMKFLLSRRWIIFLLVVGLLSWLAWILGQWQFHRLDERHERNAIIERNIEAPATAVEDLLRTDRGPSDELQWRTVTATGTYDVANTVIVRYRTRDGAPGVDVVVPLVTSDGTALVVDRGWLATENRGARPEDVPAPPTGVVTVTAWVRQDAAGDSTHVSDHSTRSINSQEIAAATGLTTYRGFADLKSENPAPDTALEPVELPDQSDGPHFFYGLQWWFFGLLAVVGFVWMAYDEWRERPASQTGQEPPVDGEDETVEVGRGR